MNIGGSEVIKDEAAEKKATASSPIDTRRS